MIRAWQIPNIQLYRKTKQCHWFDPARVVRVRRAGVCRWAEDRGAAHRVTYDQAQGFLFIRKVDPEDKFIYGLTSNQHLIQGQNMALETTSDHNERLKILECNWMLLCN